MEEGTEEVVEEEGEEGEEEGEEEGGTRRGRRRRRKKWRRRGGREGRRRRRRRWVFSCAWRPGLPQSVRHRDLGQCCQVDITNKTKTLETTRVVEIYRRICGGA